MAQLTCPIQDLCIEYNSGSNKPPNHHVRATIPCVKYISCECEALLVILPKVGEAMACNIEKKRGK